MKEQNGKPAAQTAAAPKETEKNAPDRAAEWYDRWVGKLVTADHDISDSVLIAGYLGRSPEKGTVRIYLDPCLQSAIDVETAGVLHREPIPAAASPLGGSYLWITSEAWQAAKRYQRQSGCAGS